MLSNLHKKTWMTGLLLEDYKEISSSNEKMIKVNLINSFHHDDIIILQEMLELAKSYNKVLRVFTECIENIFCRVWKRKKE